VSAEIFRLACRGAGRPSTLLAVAEVFDDLSRQELDACPSQAQIGDWAGCSTRAVRRALRSLEVLGAIYSEEAPGNRRHYSVNANATAAVIAHLESLRAPGSHTTESSAQ
jgi:hypothetical protein